MFTSGTFETPRSLLGDKRTLRGHRQTVENDPGRTFGSEIAVVHNPPHSTIW
jgi:hypothetical protein